MRHVVCFFHLLRYFIKHGRQLKHIQNQVHVNARKRSETFFQFTSLSVYIQPRILPARGQPHLSSQLRSIFSFNYERESTRLTEKKEPDCGEFF